MRYKIQIFKNLLKRYGFLQVARLYQENLRRKLFKDESYKVYQLVEALTQTPTMPETHSFKVLTMAELQQLINTASIDLKSLDLNMDFIKNLENRSDLFLAIFIANQLVCYGFLARQPTEIKSDIFFNIPSDVWYLYKCFTHEDYRGSGLLKKLVQSLQYWLEKQKDIEKPAQLLTIIDDSNLSSIRSFSKLGFKSIGRFRLKRNAVAVKELPASLGLLAKIKY